MIGRPIDRGYFYMSDHRGNQSRKVQARYGPIGGDKRDLVLASHHHANDTCGKTDSICAFTQA
jgi:hypothetical protein